MEENFCYSSNYWAGYVLLNFEPVCQTKQSLENFKNHKKFDYYYILYRTLA